MQPRISFKAAIALPTAAVVFALGIAGGGFSDQTVGVATATIWLILGGLLAGGGLTAAALRGPLAAGAVLLTALTIWTALSIGWAGDRGAAFAELVRALLYLGSFLLIGLAARAGSGPSWLAGIALGGSAIAVVAVVARLFGLGADTELATQLPAAVERLSFPLGYWNALGYLLAMTLPALGWLATVDRDRIGRGAAAASIPVVLALFLTSSRGALLAAIVGLIALAVSTSRRERLWLVAVACIPAWVAIVALAAVLRSELDPFGGLGLAGVVVGIAVALMCSLVFAVLAPSRAPGGRLRPRARAYTRPVLAVAIVAAVLVGVLAGPSSFIGDFRTERGGQEVTTATEALVSGSGRSSFWGAALSAFGDDRLRGTGAGGFEDYWNANGEIAVAIQNAHSAPLEVLAELGLIGALVLLAFTLVAVVALVRSARACRSGQRGLVGAFAGIGLAGLVSVSLDWTWQVAAAAAPLMIAIAVACGAALQPTSNGRELLVPDPGLSETDIGRPVLPTPLTGALIGLIGLTAIWAGVTVTLAAVQLDRSESRLQEGDLTGAARSAQAADRLTPWSPEPSLTLARIEQAGTNLVAAARRAERAAQLAPDDFRTWLLLGAIQADLGNVAVAGAYSTRARELGSAVVDGTTPSDPD